MAITLSITSNISSPGTLNEEDLPQTVELTAVATDSSDPSATFFYSWYIINSPSDTLSTLSSSTGTSVEITPDVWGNYRIFCIAENTITEATSETNPALANSNNFFDIRILSTNHRLEKPAASQRNWHPQYHNLVETVENLTINSATFSVSGKSEIANAYEIAIAQDKSGSTSTEDYLVVSAEELYIALSEDAGGVISNPTDNLLRERIKDIALEKINESSINELIDVDTLTIPPADGDVLTWNDTDGVWVATAPSGGGGGATELSDLTDVVISTPTGDQFLVYNGDTSQWENTTVSIPQDLSDLNDVSISTISDGQFLVYNNALSQWENETVSIPSTLEDLSDTNISSPIVGDFLRYSMGQWANEAITIPSTINDLSDVIVSLPSSGQVISYDGANWVNTSLSAGATELNDLSDVTISTPTDNQFLRYDALASEWVNETVSIPTNLDSLTDVVITSASSGQVVKYNGSNWVNGNAIDGLSSNSSNTLTVSSAYKLIPNATGQDLGGTSNRWDLFAQTGNFASDVLFDGKIILGTSQSLMQEDGTGVINIDAKGTDAQDGEINITTDSVLLTPSIPLTAGSNPKMYFDNENGKPFSIGQQSKSSITGAGIEFPSTSPAQGMWLKVDDVSGAIARLEYAYITTTQTWTSYIDTTLTSYPTLTFAATTDGGAVLSGLPAYANAAITWFKNNTGRAINIKHIDLMCLNQRSLSLELMFVKATSFANARDNNFTHTGISLTLVNNSGVDNTLGTGSNHSDVSYTLPADYCFGVVKHAATRNDNMLQIQIDYEDAITG